MYRVPHQCPVCGEKLTITKVVCHHCGTSVEGEFRGCRFCSLSAEEEKFLLTFIRHRGSIKDVEREMGISYPTVRAMLDRLIATLHADGTSDDDPQEENACDTEAGENPGRSDGENDGRNPGKVPGKVPGRKGKADKEPDEQTLKDRKTILQKLSRHEITAAEAADALQNL